MYTDTINLCSGYVVCMLVPLVRMHAVLFAAIDFAVLFAFCYR